MWRESWHTICSSIPRHVSALFQLPLEVVLKSFRVQGLFPYASLLELCLEMILIIYHFYSLLDCVAVPSASGCHIAAFEPLEPPIRPNPERVIAAWKLTKITIGTGPPTNLVEWLKDPDAVEFLKTLKFLRVGGGPLPSPVGDTLVERGVKILNVRLDYNKNA